MTEQGPEQEDQHPDVTTCVACGRPVQFYEPIGDGPGWWGHVHSGDSLSRHRVVLTDDERGNERDAPQRDLAQLRAGIEALHRPLPPDSEWNHEWGCAEDDQSWPCDTIRLLATPATFPVADAHDDGGAVVEVHSLEQMKHLVRRAADEAAVHRLARAMAERDRSSRPFDSWESEVEFILAALPQVLADLGYGTEPPASPSS